MPIGRAPPIGGGVFGDAIRYTISSVIVVVIGLILGFRPEAGPVGIVLSIVLLNACALGFGWIFTTIALIMRTPSTVMTMSWLFLMPLTFASNIFVSPATMPWWLRAFVEVNPVALIVPAVRAIMAGTATAGDIGLALLAPAIVTLVCAPLAMLL